MKCKICFFLFLMAVGTSLFAQQSQYAVREKTSLVNQSNSQDYPKNEIRLNLFQSVLGLPEINYERILEDNFGVGFYAAYSLENEYDTSLRSLLMGYGRLYLGNYKPAVGFYIEGNTGLVLQESYYSYTETPYYSSSSYYPYQYNSNPRLYAGLGIGVAAGYKFLTKNNWVGEFSLGIGRVFGNNVIVEAYPRLGISIGKRF